MTCCGKNKETMKVYNLANLVISYESKFNGKIAFLCFLKTGIVISFKLFFKKKFSQKVMKKDEGHLFVHDLSL